MDSPVDVRVPVQSLQAVKRYLESQNIKYSTMIDDLQVQYEAWKQKFMFPFLARFWVFEALFTQVFCRCCWMRNRSSWTLQLVLLCPGTLTGSTTPDTTASARLVYFLLLSSVVKETDLINNFSSSL